MRRRWPMIEAELRALVDCVKERLPAQPPSPLPDDLRAVLDRQIAKGIYESLVSSPPTLARPISPSLAKLIASEIASQILRNRFATRPVVHELVLLAPYWIGSMSSEVFRGLRDIGLKYILHGRVMPVQNVWQQILGASSVYLAYCACRGAKVADDLEGDDGDVYITVSESDGVRLLDRLIDRYRSLRTTHDAVPDTDDRLVKILNALDQSRTNGSPYYRLQTFLRRTHPAWELIPVKPGFAPVWLPSLIANRKAFRVHRELALEIATIFFLGRGAIFSTMQLFDSPYAICTCPTPENGGGCVLTNWYYQQRCDHSTIANDEFHGRARNSQGEVQPCHVFPLRSSRTCLGCGCSHQKPNPRSLETILAEADEFLTTYLASA